MLSSFNMRSTASRNIFTRGLLTLIGDRTVVVFFPSLSIVVRCAPPRSIIFPSTRKASICSTASVDATHHCANMFRSRRRNSPDGELSSACAHSAFCSSSIQSGGTSKSPTGCGSAGLSRCLRNVPEINLSIVGVGLRPAMFYFLKSATVGTSPATGLRSTRSAGHLLLCGIFPVRLWQSQSPARGSNKPIVALR